MAGRWSTRATWAASSPQPDVEPGAAITVEGLLVERGGREVLHEVSLSVARGSVTGLLGPSGCGKSTLMRSIVGVQVVAAGRVSVLGRAAGALELRRRVGYVTQAPSVYSDLSIEENLRYFAAIVGASRERVAETIRTVGLSDRRGQVVGSLSGGERSRVSLATALLSKPEVLVLDEPTVGLDPVLRGRIVDLLPRARQRRGGHAADLESRDGRGERVRCVAADARWRSARADHAERAAGTDG